MVRKTYSTKEKPPEPQQRVPSIQPRQEKDIQRVTISCPYPNCKQPVAAILPDKMLDSATIEAASLEVARHMLTHAPPKKYEVILSGEFEALRYRESLRLLDILRSAELEHKTLTEVVDVFCKALGVSRTNVKVNKADPSKAVVLDAGVTIDKKGHGTFKEEDIHVTYD